MQTLDRPTSAGEWKYSGEFPRTCSGDPVLDLLQWPMTFVINRPITVTETSGAGRICRELKMGGHAICGFKPWAGEWRKSP